MPLSQAAIPALSLAHRPTDLTQDSCELVLSEDMTDGHTWGTVIRSA
ncbi:MAG: hypothetical protein VKI42_05950 [Synechococcaceae cyanobacterium]|nr:hypothetical protein [Synechococcaceae cyanobacterium]